MSTQMKLLPGEELAFELECDFIRSCQLLCVKYLDINSILELNC
jgi:hypothetical protein